MDRVMQINIYTVVKVYISVSIGGKVKMKICTIKKNICIKVTKENMTLRSIFQSSEAVIACK